MNKYIVVENFNTYSSDEKLFLKQWINGNTFYINIRNNYKNNIMNRTLEKMFLTYDSKYKKDIYVYRGMSFYKNNKIETDYYRELCNFFIKSFNDQDDVMIDFAPASFSLKKIVADKFSKIEQMDYFSIIFKIRIRIMNEIDACSNEAAMKRIYAYENELILKCDKMIFSILKLSEKNGILELELKEI